ncbi:hypothetical protein TRV_03507, partial [Trichophyton verrucosum HKI 0517]
PKAFILWHAFLAFPYTLLFFSLLPRACRPMCGHRVDLHPPAEDQPTNPRSLTHAHFLRLTKASRTRRGHGMTWADAAGEAKEGHRGSLEANHSQQPAGHIPNPLYRTLHGTDRSKYVYILLETFFSNDLCSTFEEKESQKTKKGVSSPYERICRIYVDLSGRSTLPPSLPPPPPPLPFFFFFSRRVNFCNPNLITFASYLAFGQIW